MSYLRQLSSKGIILPPKWLPDNIIGEVITGSVSYGVSTTSSDTDVVVVVMNQVSDFFPNRIGHIYGFGKPPETFTTWQHHHAIDGDKEYDFTAYGLANWFTLLAENNPNMVDILFSPLHCIKVNTPIFQHIRAHRHLFLSKLAKHKFIGYAYAQLAKIQKKEKEGKRAEIIAKYGYDVKYAMHLVRLCYECEQILTECDLDLTRHSEQLAAIRGGAWKEEEVVSFFQTKEKEFDRLYAESKLPHKADMEKIKALLLECIEMHYGKVSDLPQSSRDAETIRKIRELVS